MTTIGRRERRKVQTRQALADAALELFLENGYDRVTVAQIAEAADVSLATLFKHVPDGKEALIFDDGTERREAMVAAVRGRPAGVSILRALHAFLADRGTFAIDMPADVQRKRDLVVSTPALAGYQRKLWLRGEALLTETIAVESGREPGAPEVRALVRYVLEIPDLISLDTNPRASLDAVFRLLETGWAGITGDQSASR
jgi:AcrR family transcriptional regulator